MKSRNLTLATWVFCSAILAVTSNTQAQTAGGREKAIKPAHTAGRKTAAKKPDNAGAHIPSVTTAVPKIPEMVLLPSGIAMGKYEVTQTEWTSIMGDNPANFTDCGGEHCPVETVSWNEAQSYIEKLNQLTHRHFRLPTETEWFAACQAGAANVYCGSSDLDAVGWYLLNSENHTVAVGRRQANAWGLHDMSGNVWEWTQSCERGNCHKAASAWQQLKQWWTTVCLEENCKRRIVRGGSWYNDEQQAKADYSYALEPAAKISSVGLRLVEDLPRAPAQPQ